MLGIDHPASCYTYQAQLPRLLTSAAPDLRVRDTMIQGDDHGMDRHRMGQEVQRTLGNLTNTKTQAEGFYNTLSAVRRFNWGDDAAWDVDFEQQGRGTPSAGTDTTWRTTSTQSSSGHGSQGDSTSAGRSTTRREQHRDHLGIGTRVRRARCPPVLEEKGVFDRWGWPVFRGLHLLCGFHTVTADESNRGRLFAQYLNAGRTVRQAWIRAAQDTEGSATSGLYLRADGNRSDTYNDHWWGKGSVGNDPTNPDHLWYAAAR